MKGMAVSRDLGENVVLKGSFYSRGKRLRVSLTTKTIYWELEATQEICTVIPLNQLIAVTPCDCSAHHKSKQSKCQYCMLSRFHLSRTLAGVLNFHAKALRLHYALPAGKHSWKLESEVFYPAENAVLKDWISAINDVLAELNRPKKLMIFVNPYGGKKKGLKIYEDKVSPLLHLAGIDAHMIVTQRANHAKEIIQEINIYKFDGIVCVGGDGIFSEILNSLLLKTQKEKGIDINDAFNTLVPPRIPLGIIPAGSTNAAAYCITGTNDPIAATLLIIMGDCVGIDVCGVHHQGNFLRFAVTFLSYGYFGDVIADSEKLRWMGPKRYDYSGLKKILGQRLYEGELQLQVSAPSDRSSWEHERCRSGCSVCNKAGIKSNADLISNNSTEKLRWLTVRGRFIGVNTAIMSCACCRAQDGISPSQHIGNGYCDVIIVSSCSRFNYLRYLLRTACHHRNPFDLDFVQVYRVREFMFSPYVTEDKTPQISCTGTQENWEQLQRNSVWDCDGEVLTEPSIYSKVHCQLVNVFGRGCEDREVESSHSGCFGFCKKEQG